MADGDPHLGEVRFDTTGTGIGPYPVREFTSESGTYTIRYVPRDGVLIWTDRDYGQAACALLEWLCVYCKVIFPPQEGARLTAPCPRCGSAMIPTSPALRALEDMRTEIEVLRAVHRTAETESPEGDDVTVARRDLAYLLISVPDGSRKASWKRLSGLARL